jgi:hypothetical protein
MAISSDDDVAIQQRREPRLCGTVLGARAHICAFFRNTNEEDRALLPFMKGGLAAGEKVIHTIDPMKRADNINRFAAAGIDFAAAHQQGQFDLHAWTETHLSGGGFDPGRTLAFFKQAGLNASRQGFPLTRFVTHMEWALEDGVVLTDLLAYEAKANEIWLGQPGPIHPVICAYDLTRFSGEVIVDVMRTHPMTLIDGILHENPYFVPPEEFIRELGNRRTARTVRS